MPTRSSWSSQTHHGWVLAKKWGSDGREVTGEHDCLTAESSHDAHGWLRTDSRSVCGIGGCLGVSDEGSNPALFYNMSGYQRNPCDLRLSSEATLTQGIGGGDSQAPRL